MESLVQYHDGPVATITQYLHSLLMKAINKNGYKVAISGTAAEELFTGYYDHFLLHFHETKNKESYSKNVSDWKKFIFNSIRNPILKDPDLYVRNSNFRDHIYDNKNS